MQSFELPILRIKAIIQFGQHVCSLICASTCINFSKQVLSSRGSHRCFAARAAPRGTIEISLSVINRTEFYDILLFDVRRL